MDRTQQVLQNPEYKKELRYQSRSSVYVSRSSQNPSKIIQDIFVSSSPRQKFKLTSSDMTRLNNSLPKQSLTASSDVVEIIQKPKSMVQPSIIVLKRQVISGQPQLPTSRTRKVDKSLVLISRSVSRPNRESAAIPIITHSQSKLLYVMAGVIFILGLAACLSSLLTNHRVAAQVNQLSSQDGAANSSSSSKPQPPSVIKPSATSIASYKVAPNLPRYIDITKLSVHSRVLSLGVKNGGALATPSNVFDTGWYNASAQPGQPGAMLIDGHISSWSTPGVFHGLIKLTAGDAITITRGDGRIFTYKVVKTQLSDVASVDMGSLLVSQDTSKPGLNLITCSGEVIPGTNEFDKRLVIYAVMVE